MYTIDGKMVRDFAFILSDKFTSRLKQIIKI